MSELNLELEISSKDPSIILLCQTYWNWVQAQEEFAKTVAVIAEEFNLKSGYEAKKIVTEFCVAYTKDVICSRCKKHYLAFTSRTDYIQKRKQNPSLWVCNTCQNEIANMQAEERAKVAEVTQRLHIQKMEKRRKIIQSDYSMVNRDSIDIKQLTLKDLVYLLSVIRGLASEDFSYINPLEIVDIKLTPTHDYGYEILRHLYRRKLLYVHPKSDPNAFDWEDDDIKSIYLGRVSWVLPQSKIGKDESSIVKEIENVIYEMDWSDDWYNEQLLIWKEIGLYECLEYLEICLQEHKLPFKPGEKTQLVIEQSLNDFAIAQIYNFIWRASRDAAAFLVRNNSTKQHAANTVIGSIQRMAERAKAQSWDVKRYGRNYNCPQSIISQVYFNAILQIGDDGFNQVPFKI